MYDVLKDIIHKDAQLKNYNSSNNNFFIKESEENAKCKKITLCNFESEAITMGFKLDSKSKSIKCGRLHKISPYFADGKNLDKGNDGIIFTTLDNKQYVFICELKDGGKGYMEQFKNKKSDLII